MFRLIFAHPPSIFESNLQLLCNRVSSLDTCKALKFRRPSLFKLSEEAPNLSHPESKPEVAKQMPILSLKDPSKTSETPLLEAGVRPVFLGVQRPKTLSGASFDFVEQPVLVIRDLHLSLYFHENSIYAEVLVSYPAPCRRNKFSIIFYIQCD